MDIPEPTLRSVMLEQACLALSAAQTVVNASTHPADPVRRKELLAFMEWNLKRIGTARSEHGAQLASASAVACAQVLLEDCGFSLSLQALAA